MVEERGEDEERRPLPGSPTNGDHGSGATARRSWGRCGGGSSTAIAWAARGGGEEREDG